MPCRSKDEEIELVTLDDFYKTAPADISRPVSFSLLSKLLNFVSCALERLAFIFRIILLIFMCRIYLLISEQNYILNSGFDTGRSSSTKTGSTGLGIGTEKTVRDHVWSINCGIIIVHGESMYVDFVRHPYSQIHIRMNLLQR